MIRVGIDPGNTHSAFAIFRDDEEDFQIGSENDVEFIHANKLPNEDFLYKVVDAIFAAVKIGDSPPIDWTNLDVTIEMPGSYGKGNTPGASVFLTALFAGRVLQRIYDKTGVKPTLIYRQTVKSRVLGRAFGKDSEIRATMIRIFGEPGTKKNPGKTYGVSADMWAALAVATASALGSKKIIF
jgi:hypothetical protein